MGNISCSKRSIDIGSLTSELNFISEKDDPRYGKICLYENSKTKEIVAYKELISKTTADFKKEVQFLEARCREDKGDKVDAASLSDASNIVKVIGFATQTHDDMCSSFFKITLVIEYIEQDLLAEIIEKKTSNQPYSEEQIWLLLENIVAALAVLHREKIPVYDVKPANVLVTKDGTYKIADPVLINSHTIPGYMKLLTDREETESVYLSPELLKGLSNQEIHPKHDPYKSDIFAAGLTILHALTLEPCDNFYDWNTFTFRTGVLNETLESAANNYSEKLIGIIRRMVSNEEGSRPYALEVLEELKQAKWREQWKHFAKRATKSGEDEEIAVENTVQTKPQIVKVSGGYSEEANVSLEKNPDQQGKENVPEKIPFKEHPENRVDKTEQEMHHHHQKNLIEKYLTGSRAVTEEDYRKPSKYDSKILEEYKKKYPNYVAKTLQFTSSDADSPKKNIEESGARNYLKYLRRDPKSYYTSLSYQPTKEVLSNQDSALKYYSTMMPIKTSYVENRTPYYSKYQHQYTPSKTTSSYIIEKEKTSGIPLNSRSLNLGAIYSQHPGDQSDRSAPAFSLDVQRVLSKPANPSSDFWSYGNDTRPKDNPVSYFIGSDFKSNPLSAGYQGVSSIQGPQVGLASVTGTSSLDKSGGSTALPVYKYTPDLLVKSILEQYGGGHVISEPDQFKSKKKTEQSTHIILHEICLRYHI